ncbi:hypothetical protein K435DRAFT_807683 [Dendrothele bispora CBS 962.96]|uniref:Uncharacterized protein n=1 Tax=Dendrothele bispora (strain CBS 962.96) TaxID=1314807 RepID=A0A4S8L4H5_DENBC|nr:hypothetical protein K435DRAFT_807683 [Dendrothele bispora CBS 962.96]
MAVSSLIEAGFIDGPELQELSAKEQRVWRRLDIQNAQGSDSDTETIHTAGKNMDSGANLCLKDIKLEKDDIQDVRADLEKPFCHLKNGISVVVQCFCGGNNRIDGLFHSNFTTGKVYKSCEPPEWESYQGEYEKNQRLQKESGVQNNKKELDMGIQTYKLGRGFYYWEAIKDE